MDKLRVRCRSCGMELEGNKCCGCSNMTTIHGNSVSAVDMSKVVMLNNPALKSESKLFTNEDLAWHEARRKRKIRKLDFEIR